MGILKVLAVICVFTAVVIGFVFLEKYVKKQVPISEKTGTLVLVDVPGWVNEQLKEKIYTAAIAGGEDLKLDEDAAESIQRNIESLVAWVDGVQVQVTGSSIHIEARFCADGKSADSPGKRPVSNNKAANGRAALG